MAIKHLKFLTNSLTNLASSSSPSSNSSSENKLNINSNVTFNNQKEKIAVNCPVVVENESYQLGFKECLSETLRFLVEFEGFSLNQDFVQYPGSQSASPPQNGETQLQSSNGNGGGGGGGGGGGFHLTKLVAHLDSHLDRVVESRLKHPQEISLEALNWPRSQFLPSTNSPFEIKVTTAEEMGNESDMPMEESGFELRNMLLPDSKRNPFQRSSNEEMGIRREMVESPLLSISSQSKGSYKKEIKDRFLRMRVQSGVGTNDAFSGNQERTNAEKPNYDPSGSTSTFFSSSASSSSGSSAKASTS